MTALLADRFWAKVERTETCWLWTGSVLRNGYGRLWTAGTPDYAHRISHEMFIGPIPDGLEIDHLCRVRNCVNPHHLEAVTHAENIRRAVERRTHCVNGHEYSATNVAVTAGGTRRCVTCRNAWYQAHPYNERPQAPRVSRRTASHAAHLARVRAILSGGAA